MLLDGHLLGVDFLCSFAQGRRWPGTGCQLFAATPPLPSRLSNRAETASAILAPCAAVPRRRLGTHAGPAPRPLRASLGKQPTYAQGWGVTAMLQRVQAAPDMLAALQMAAIQMQMGMGAVPNGMGGSGLGGSNGAGRRPPPPQQPAGRT